MFQEFGGTVSLDGYILTGGNGDGGVIDENGENKGELLQGGEATTVVTTAGESYILDDAISALTSDKDFINKIFQVRFRFF